MRKFLAVAFLVGCGSSFTSGQAVDDAGAGDVTREASADAGDVADGTQWADAAGDVASADAGEASAHDASADVVDAAPCAPLSSSYAQAPCTADYGPPTTPLGTYYWLVQPQATPPACWARALNDAGLVCAQCESTWTCACLVASFGDAGLAAGITCTNGPYGPYLSE